MKNNRSANKHSLVLTTAIIMLTSCAPNNKSITYNYNTYNSPAGGSEQGTLGIHSNLQTLPTVNWNIQKYMDQRRIPDGLAKQTIYESVSDTLFILGNELDSFAINNAIGNFTFASSVQTLKLIVINALKIKLNSPVRSKGIPLSISAGELIIDDGHVSTIIKRDPNAPYGQIITTPDIIVPIDLRVTDKGIQDGIPGGALYLNIAEIKYANDRVANALANKPVFVTNGSQGGPAIVGTPGAPSGELKFIDHDTILVNGHKHRFIFKHSTHHHMMSCPRGPDFAGTCEQEPPTVKSVGSSIWPPQATSATDSSTPGVGGLWGEIILSTTTDTQFPFDQVSEMKVGPIGSEAPILNGGVVKTSEGEKDSQNVYVAQEIVRTDSTRAPIPPQFFIHPVTKQVIQRTDCAIYEQSFQNGLNRYRCILTRTYKPGTGSFVMLPKDFGKKLDGQVTRAADLRPEVSVSKLFIQQQKKVAQYLMWNSAYAQLGLQLSHLNKMIPTQQVLAEFQRFVFNNKNLSGKPINEAPVFKFKTEHGIFSTMISKALEQYSNIEILIEIAKKQGADLAHLQNLIEKTVKGIADDAELYSDLKHRLRDLQINLNRYQTEYLYLKEQVQEQEFLLKDQAEQNVQGRQARLQRLAALETVGVLISMSPIGPPVTQIIGAMAQSGSRMAKSQTLAEVVSSAKASIKDLKKFESLDIAFETEESLNKLQSDLQLAAIDISGRKGSPDFKKAQEIFNQFSEYQDKWNQFLETQSNFQIPQSEFDAELAKLKQQNPEYLNLVNLLESVINRRQSIIDDLTRYNMSFERLLMNWDSQKELLNALEKSKVELKNHYSAGLVELLKNWQAKYIEVIAEALVHLKLSYDYITLSDNQFMLQPLNDLIEGRSALSLNVSVNNMLFELNSRVINNFRSASQSILLNSDNYGYHLNQKQIEDLKKYKSIEIIIGQEALPLDHLNVRLSGVQVESKFAANENTRTDQKAQIKIMHLGQGYLQVSPNNWSYFEFPNAKQIYHWGQSVQLVGGQLRYNDQKVSVDNQYILDIFGLNKSGDQKFSIYANPPLTARYLVVLDDQSANLDLESLSLNFEYEYASSRK
jgi:hypothetical protein